MFARLNRNSSLQRAIAVFIILQFVASSIAVKGYAAAENLRPAAAKNDGGRVKNLSNDLVEKSSILPFVVDYDSPLAELKSTAGGKCAQLAWAYNRVIPTPLGFNISVEAVRAYYRHNPKLIEMIKEVRELDTTNAKKRSEMSKRIKNYMMTESKLPPEVTKEVMENYIAISKKISKERGYSQWQFIPMAYRGSGIIEDFEGAIPWFTKSIGAQPGQGTTLLNKVGIEPIEPSTIEVIAGLFNDQIFGYRDVQIFFDFVSKMKNVSEYNQLIELSQKYGFTAGANKLKEESSPGYVNLRKMLEEIEKNEAGVKAKYDWLAKLEKSASDILDPMNFTTGIAVLEMVDPLGSGTAFTSNMATGFDGSTYARIMKEKSKKDKGILSIFPSFKKRGENFKGYTRYVKINLGTGLGPGVVEGRFQPNIVTLFDKTGNGDWVFFEKTVGRKHMSLIGIEKVIASLKGKFAEDQIYRLAKLYADWAAAVNDKDATKQKDVAGVLKKEFNIDADSWARSMKDIWFFFERPNKYLATDAEKQALHKILNVSEKEFFTLSSLVSAINKINTGYDTAAYVQTSPEIAASSLLDDKGYKMLADLIVMVGDNMAQERFAAGDKGWRERRDVEFAIAPCLENDSSKFKIKLEHTYDLVTGEDLGPGWVKMIHLQNRPINPEKEIQDPNNIIFKRMMVDEDYIEANGIQPLASGGLMGFGAAEGAISFVDPNKDLADQETEILELKGKGHLQIADVEEMGPEHDAIVGVAGAGVVRKGNDTSHAYIFSLELRIPIVINAVLRAGVQLTHGLQVVIDALHGAIYPGDRGIKLVKDDLIIRVNMLPKTIVGFIVSTLQTAMEIARVGGKAVLVRQEFILLNTIKIYPQAGRTYDLIAGLKDGKITEKDLTADDLKDIEALKKFPEEIEAIKKIITGFPSAEEFIAEQMHYAANQLGTIFVEDDEIRDYDNKEKEALMSGLVGAKLFLKYDDKDPRYDSPLDGMRGSQLMSHPHLKKAFFPLKRGVLRSIKDGYKNNAFFFVYLRTGGELKIQLSDFEMLCFEEGVFPEYIVVMIENGGNIWIIEEVAAIMADFVERHRKDGVKGYKISFGTNDLNNSLGGTSRDDKDFTGEVRVMHPALINVEPEQGKIEVNPGYVYGPKAKGQPFIITINDETAPVVLRTVEHVSAVVEENGGKKNLCGQAPTKAITKGDWKSARAYVGMLDAAGTQSVTYVPMVMLDFDTKASFTRIDAQALEKATSVVTLTNIREDAKNLVMAGDVVVVESPEDILKMNKGKNKQKIVIMKNTWDRDDLENKGIAWDYLNYAGAILLDENVKDGTGVLKEPIIKTRIKATIPSDTSLITGKDVTIDFSTATVYQGKLATHQEKPALKKMRMPAPGLVPQTRSIMRFSASDLFEPQGDKSAVIDIHPLAFVMYKEDPASVPEDARKAVKELIGSQDPMEYLQSRISEYVAQKTQEAIKNGQTPVYTVFRLARNQMRFLKGGEAIEITKGKEGTNFDDPRKRLQGGTRAISDFWPILDLELSVFSKEKVKNPALALQTSKMGTRVQEIIEMQLRVFKSFDITPDNTDIGLELTTSADPVMIEDYIKQGIKFFGYKDKELAEALLAANLENPDIFAVEGKEQVAQQVLPRPLAYVKGIVAENKDKGVWLGLTPEQLVKQLKAADENVFKGLSTGFDNFIGSLKELKNASDSGLVIGANAVFENAGTLTALKKIKDAQSGLKIVFWAKDKAEADQLRAVGGESITDIVIAESLAQTLKVLKEFQVANNRIVLVNSDPDNKNIKEEFQVKDIAEFLAKPEVKGIRVLALHEASTFVKGESINNMPLVLARATAAVYKDEGQVVKQYEELSQNSGLSEDTLKALNDLDQDFATVPLVKVSEEVAKAQVTYEETISKI